MPQEQFFQADGLACGIRRKSQGACAEAADGARRNFERPNAFIIYAELCVDRPLRKSERANCVYGASFDFALLRSGEARGRDVDGLFEIGPFERIRFVKNSEDAKLAISQQPSTATSLPGMYPSTRI